MLSYAFFISSCWLFCGYSSVTMLASLHLHIPKISKQSEVKTAQVIFSTLLIC